MNLVEEEEMRPGSPSNPKKQKKRHEYLDSSVKATLLLAVIEQIPETRAIKLFGNATRHLPPRLIFGPA